MITLPCQGQRRDSGKDLGDNPRNLVACSSIASIPVRVFAAIKAEAFAICSPCSGPIRGIDDGTHGTDPDTRNRR